MNVDRSYAKAFALYQSGRIEMSRQICEKILKKNPRHINALNMLGVIFFHGNDLHSAHRYLKKVIELNPDNVDALVNFGNVLQKRGQLEEAMACAEKIINHDASNAEAHNIIGMIHHKGGEIEGAITSYQKAIQLKPSFAHAYSNLGLALEDTGRFEEAITCLKKAVQYDPKNFDACTRLGMIFRDKGNLNESIIWFHRALTIDPTHVLTYGNLGKVLHASGKSHDAISIFQQALRLDPKYADGYYNIAVIYHQQQHIDKAITYYRKAIQFDGTYPPSFNNLGTILHGKGKTDEAIELFQQAIGLNPGYADAHYNMGTVLQERGDLDGAKACYEKAISLNPRLMVAFNNLGNVIAAQGNLEKAVAIFRRALETNPASALILNNLGNVLKDQGKLAEAETVCRRAIEIKPDFLEACSNFLFFSNYSFFNTPQIIHAEHVRLGERFDSISSVDRNTHRKFLSPDRKLRIGYVSPDFREHSVAYFIEPVIREHTSSRCEVICYSHSFINDHVTERIKHYADGWRDIARISDDNAATWIRDDGIDILVDLTGHTGNNRLPLFARRPAPVQVTWIGYPATTGLRSIDYKIVDHYTDPIGVTDHFYTEQLLRLPEAFLCYLPDSNSPDVSEPPVLTSGHISFGSFNNFPKISPIAISMWQSLLHSLPTSRLVVKAKSFSDDSVRRQFLESFKRAGIGEERIDLISWAPSRREHLGLYSRIDIGLDTFPYHGTTTTCEALWMGVPVITLEGDTHASRVGVSLLSNAGLAEFIAHSAEEYVAKAVALAHDLTRLQSLRHNLRTMLSRSPLTDAKRFVQHLENAYRNMWHRYCEQS